MTKWHEIKGFDSVVNYDTNKRMGVDLPNIGSDVLVVYPDVGKEVYVKRASENGMSGTSYYNGTLWAYFDRPIIN